MSMPQNQVRAKPEARQVAIRLLIHCWAFVSLFLCSSFTSASLISACHLFAMRERPLSLQQQRRCEERKQSVCDCVVRYQTKNKTLL